eukprot:m.454768 g.454768  ORF g.454768 m.454768 type:complete len:1643 (+) comp20739_c0_seq1:109-5037(+)
MAGSEGGGGGSLVAQMRQTPQQTRVFSAPDMGQAREADRAVRRLGLRGSSSKSSDAAGNGGPQLDQSHLPKYMHHTSASASKTARHESPSRTTSLGDRPKKKKPTPKVKVQVQTPVLGRKNAPSAIPQTPPPARRSASNTPASSRPNSVASARRPDSAPRPASAALRAIESGEVPRYMHHTASSKHRKSALDDGPVSFARSPKRWSSIRNLASHERGMIRAAEQSSVSPTAPAPPVRGLSAAGIHDREWHREAESVKRQVGRPLSVNPHDAEAKWSASARTVALATPVDLQQQAQAARISAAKRKSRESPVYDVFVDDEQAAQRARLAEEDARQRLAEAERKRRAVEAATRKKKAAAAEQARIAAEQQAVADDQARRDRLVRAARERRDAEYAASVRESEAAAAKARRLSEASLRAKEREEAAVRARDAEAAERARQAHLNRATERHSVGRSSQQRGSSSKSPDARGPSGSARGSTGSLRSESGGRRDLSRQGSTGSGKAKFNAPPPPTTAVTSLDDEETYSHRVGETLPRPAVPKQPAEPFYSAGAAAASTARSGEGGSRTVSKGGASGASGRRGSGSQKNRGTSIDRGQGSGSSRRKGVPDPSVPTLEDKIQRAKAQRASRGSSMSFDPPSTSETDVAAEPPAPPKSVAPDVGVAAFPSTSPRTVGRVPSEAVYAVPDSTTDTDVGGEQPAPPRTVAPDVGGLESSTRGGSRPSAPVHGVESTSETDAGGDPPAPPRSVPPGAADVRAARASPPATLLTAPAATAGSAGVRVAGRRPQTVDSTSETDVNAEPPAPPASTAPDFTEPSEDDLDLPEAPTSAPPDLPPIVESQPPKLPRIIHVNLTKNSKGLGIEFTGERDPVTSIVTGLTVDKIHPGSAAAIDGRLRVGESILEINRRRVAELRKDEIQRYLAQSERSVCFGVFDDSGRRCDDDPPDALIKAATRSPDEVDPEPASRSGSGISRDTQLSANSQRLIELAKAKPSSVVNDSGKIAEDTEASAVGGRTDSSQPPQRSAPAPSSTSTSTTTPAAAAAAAGQAGARAQTPPADGAAAGPREVEIEMVRPSYASKWGFGLGKDPAGNLVVTSINSPGLAYGKLVAGDRILAVNDMAIVDDDFVKNKMKASKKLSLRVLRGGDGGSRPSDRAVSPTLSSTTGSPKGGSAGEDIALTLKKPPTAKKWGVSFDSQHVSAGVFMHAVKSVTADSPCNGSLQPGDVISVINGIPARTLEKEQLTSHFQASSVDLTVRRARSQRRVPDGGTGPGAAEVVPASDRRVRRKSSNGSIRRERVRTASFERTPQGKFGLQLTGPKHAPLARGSTTAANAVYVAGLAKDCGGQGQLNPGDRIVDVNGTEVVGLTVDAVNQLITATPANAAVRIRVVADPDGFAEQNMMERSSTPETSGRDSRDSNSAATVATPRSPLGGQPQPSLSPPGSTAAGDSTSPQSQPQQPSPRMVPRKVVVAPAAAEAPSATPQAAPSNAATAPTEAAVPTTTFAMSPSPSSFPASPPPPQRTSSSAVSQGSRGSSGSATGGASSEAADKRAQIKAERARAKAEKEAEKKRAKEQQEAEKKRAKEQLEAEKRRQKALKEEQKKAKKSSKDSSGSADIPMAIPDIAPPESSFLFAKAAAPPPESSFLFAKRD